ncbi:uncharacterized protein LOC112495321 isoform X2 [Cephus cinctus]|nr:uncharacterized protein LOC112495321 isoform X2 [Cephus cinctus]
MDQYGTALHYDQAIQGLSGLDRHSLRLIRCRINPHSIGYDRGITAMSWMGEPIGLSSRNTKPPIREPNMPEKPKKEEKKEKKQKKPVIRVDGADEVTNILEPGRKEISHSDETNCNCQWGVKLAESTARSDKPVLRNIPEYVIKQKWGVNVKEYLTKAEAAATAASEAEPKETAKDTREVDANYVNLGSASNARTRTHVTSGDAPQSPLQLKNIQVHQAGDSLEASNRRTADSTGNDISKDMENDDRSIAERAEIHSERSESIGKEIRDSKQFERCLDCDYNIPENIPLGGEISAWEDVAVKSKIREHSLAANRASAKPTKSSSRIFIRPEPPQPKLDIETVRAANEWDDIEDEVNRSEYKALRSMEIKRALNRMDPLSAFRKIDYTTQKKLHTYSTCSPYTLYFDNNLPVNKIIRTRMKVNTVSSAGSNSRKEFNTELGKIRKIPRNQNPIEQLEVQSPIDLESLTTQPKLSTVVTGMLQSDQEETKTQLTVKDSGATVDKIEDNEALLKEDSNLLSHEREAEMVLAISSNEDASDDHVNSSEDLEHDESTESDGPAEAFLSKEISSDSEEKSFLNFDSPKKSVSLRVTSESSESPEFLVNEEHSTTSSWHNRNDLKEKYELSNSQEEEGYEEDDEFIIDGDFIRMPGDPYPYSRDNIKRWQVPSGKGISKEDSAQPPLSTSANEAVRTYDNYKVSELASSPNSERAATQFSDSRHRMETDSIQHQAPVRKMSRTTQKERKTSSISKLGELSEAREHSPLRYYKTAIENHLVPNCLRNNSKQNFSTNQQNSSLRGNPILSPRAIYAESYLFNIDRRSILNDKTETSESQKDKQDDA